MGHLHGNGLAGGFLPVLDEGFVELLIEFAGRIIADIDQGAVLPMGRDGKAQHQRRCEGGIGEQFRCVLQSLSPTEIHD